MAETCYNSYHLTKTGLGPEVTSDHQCLWRIKRDTYKYNSFSSVPQSFRYDDELRGINSEFILRPEVVESIWYAWRLTGDPVWQERAWEIFQALEQHCKTSAGYHGLRHVDNPQAGFIDET